MAEAASQVEAAPPADGDRSIMANLQRDISQQDRERIRQTVRECEAHTSAEFVPIVAEASGRYDRSEDLIGIAFGIGLLTTVWALLANQLGSGGDWGGLPSGIVLMLLLTALLLGYLAGVVLASRVRWLRRLSVPRTIMAQEVAGRASQLFFDNRIHHTDRETGVVIYVSIFERRAVILADRAAFDVLSQQTINELTEELVNDIREHGIATAICNAVQALTDQLAGDMPPTSEAEKNEIADALVLIEGR